MTGITPAVPPSPLVMRHINDLLIGVNHSVGQVTLAVAPATSTVVTARACSTSSCVTLMPANAHAATEWGGTSLYVTPGKEAFTVFHSSSANSRIFRYVVHTGTRQL